MQETNQDLTEDFKRFADDDIDAMDRSNSLKLELQAIQLELAKSKLEQEIQIAKAAELKNQYKPELVTTLKFVVWVGYALFAFLILCNNAGPEAPNVRTAGLILTGVIPTAILLVIIKAMFSTGRDDNKEIEAVPTVAVIKEASKPFNE